MHLNKKNIFVHEIDIIEEEDELSTEHWQEAAIDDIQVHTIYIYIMETWVLEEQNVKHKYAHCAHININTSARQKSVNKRYFAYRKNYYYFYLILCLQLKQSAAPVDRRRFTNTKNQFHFAFTYLLDTSPCSVFICEIKFSSSRLFFFSSFSVRRLSFAHFTRTKWLSK